MRLLPYETYYLGVRTTRRIFRVPSNWIAIIFFPLIHLLIFGQLYQQIVQLPGFGGQTSYLAYLVPGQVAFTAFMAVAWSGIGMIIEYRTGYLDKLRAQPIGRWSILGGRDGAAVHPGRGDGRRAARGQPAARRDDGDRGRSGSC